MNHHAKPHTMSAREFNQNTSGAKKAATEGPLVITDRGKPSYVLMTHAEFERLKKPQPKRFVSVLESLEQKGGPEYDFEIEFERNPVADEPLESGPWQRTTGTAPVGLRRPPSLAAIEQTGGPELDYKMELPRREVWAAEIDLEDFHD